MSFFLEPIEPIRVSQPLDFTNFILNATLALQVVHKVLYGHENAELQRECDDLLDMFCTPWRA